MSGNSRRRPVRGAASEPAGRRRDEPTAAARIRGLSFDDIADVLNGGPPSLVYESGSWPHGCEGAGARVVVVSDALARCDRCATVVGRRRAEASAIWLPDLERRLDQHVPRRLLRGAS